jgi:hypothetical protein
VHHHRILYDPAAWPSSKLDNCLAYEQVFESFLPSSLGQTVTLPFIGNGTITDVSTSFVGGITGAVIWLDKGARPPRGRERFKTPNWEGGPKSSVTIDLRVSRSPAFRSVTFEKREEGWVITDPLYAPRNELLALRCYLLTAFTDEDPPRKTPIAPIREEIPPFAWERESTLDEEELWTRVRSLFVGDPSSADTVPVELTRILQRHGDVAGLRELSEKARTQALRWATIAAEAATATLKGLR